VGKLLVGGVCTNEADPIQQDNTKQGTSGMAENAWVMQLDPAGAGSFTTLATFSLNYPHYADSCIGNVSQSTFPPIQPSVNSQAAFCWSNMWHAWTDDWSGIKNWWANNYGSSTLFGSPKLYHGAYSQPMLTGIDQLADGSFVLGIADRMNYQTGWYNAPPSNDALTDPNLQVKGSATGDVLLACKTGASSWVLENDGGCASYQATARPWSSTAAFTGQREFFDDNLKAFESATFSGTDGVHIETFTSAVQVWPPTGTQRVAFTAMDPATTLNSGGVRWASATNGDVIAAMNIVDPTQYGSSTYPPLFDRSTFSKNVSLGGMEMVCDLAPAEIGNRVWIDTNKNGLQEAGEPAVPGVTVHLYDSKGTLVGTAVTDANGQYYFRSTTTETPAGNGDNTGPLPLREAVAIRMDNAADYAAAGPLYTYGLTQPNTASANGAVAGASNSNATVIDSFPQIDVPAVQPGTVELTYDAGFIPVHAVGSRVWVDLDQDGVQDPGEPGLSGVTVQLLNADGSPAKNISGSDAVTVTDGLGNYVLTDLALGNYRVQFVLPPDGSTFTTKNAASSTSKNDSNPDPGTGITDVFTLAATATGDTVASSDPTSVGGIFSNPTIDAGVVGLRPVAFSGQTWHDPVGNGNINDFIVDIQGVKVELFLADGVTPAVDFDGNPVAPVYSMNWGGYYFDNLLPGTYKAKFTAPAGYTPTKQYGFSDPTGDSNIDANGWTDLITLRDYASPGMDNDIGGPDYYTADWIQRHIDAGYTTVGPLPKTSIGNFVWLDTDRDGVQDVGEPPLVGARVTLVDSYGNFAYDANWNDVGWKTTDANGYYYFDNLVPGNYRVLFQPGNYVPTSQFSGANSAVDSNPALSYVTIDEHPYNGNGALNGESGYLTPWEPVLGLVSGNTIADVDGSTLATFVNPTVDAGFVPLEPVAVGNFTWIDSNRDGIQDIGESVLAGVKVELFDTSGNSVKDASGNTVTSVTTDVNGHYLFDNLRPGDYKIKFTPPDGYLPTTANAATSTSANDSNPGSDGWTASFTVTLSATGDTVADVDGSTLATFVNPTIDAGFVPLAAISNYYWYDANEDGLRNNLELPVVGGTVHLLKTDGTAATYPDGTEVPAATTDSNGYFQFTGLLPGDYKLKFDRVAGWTFTTQGSVPTTDNDSNADPSTGITQAFTVASSVTGATSYDDPNTNAYPRALYYNPTVGAGLIPPQPVAVGDFTWIDVDRDGIQDVGEPVLAGVKVELFDTSGNAVYDVLNNEVKSVTTDINGKYLFDNLLPGDYKVKFTPPAGYLYTTKNAVSSTSANDSNAASDGWTAAFTVAGSATGDTVADVDGTTLAAFVNPTIDAGFVPVMALGNYVWIDANVNGIQDDGELPLPGATVYLTDSSGKSVLDVDGNTVASVTTDVNGKYLFDNLLQGTYKVRFVLPGGYFFTKQTAGADRTLDSHPNSRGLSASIALLPVGAHVVADTDETTKAVLVDPTIDAGVVEGSLPVTGASTLELWRYVAFVVLVGLTMLALGRRRRPTGAA